MALILQGAPVAGAMTETLRPRILALKERGVCPALAVVRVGEKPEQLSYERAAARRCAALGVAFRSFALAEDCGQAALLAAIEEINRDGEIHGCMLLRPLTPGLDEYAACQALRPEKDVDGMTAASLGAVFTGRGRGYPPCTAQACMEVLDYYQIPLPGARAAVIGRSLVVGRPLAMLLQARNATVTLCHSRSVNLPALCREQEILIAAAGSAGMVDESYVNQNQVILDVGVNADGEGHLCGDVCFARVEPLVRALSPVPGGVGAVTTTVIIKHVIQAAEAARQ